MQALSISRALAAAALALAAFAGPSLARQDPPLSINSTNGPLAAQASAKAMLAKAARAGRVAVMVGLNINLADEDMLTPAAAQAQVDQLIQAQDGVVSRAGLERGAGLKRFTVIPYIAIHASRAQLARLLSDPAVRSIAEDIVLDLLVDESTHIIRADALRRREGITGEGQVVAVLDTGVDTRHPMLKRKLVSEACFSTTSSFLIKSESLCPNGSSSSFRPGSGANCPANIRNCEHGTHVASIAVGRSPVHLGVAPHANLISIKVVSKFTDNVDCNNRAPCAKPVASDIAAGLERVYLLRRKYNIAAANMSIGSPVPDAHSCQSFAAASGFSDIVTKLRHVGIPMVTAAGNSALKDIRRFFPACIPEAIAVAATNDDDRMWANSSFSPDVKFFAPGVDITAAAPAGSKCLKPGEEYCTFSGTSQATPHVSGAFALMRESDPDVPPDDAVQRILSALSCGGKQVEGRVGFRGLQRPRIDVFRAYRELIAADPAEDFHFNTSDDGDAWSQTLGRWVVKNNTYTTKAWPADQRYVMTSHDYCTASARITAVIRRRYNAVVDGGAGLLLASNILASRSLVAVSGYFISYNFNNVTVQRLDNFTFKGSSDFTAGAVPMCTAFFAVDLTQPHIISVTVVPDGKYIVVFDDKNICQLSTGENFFVDRVHPPPTKIAVIGDNKSGDTNNALDVFRVKIDPMH
jgi:subtilisin